MDPRFSRAYGALSGLALGDALGMPTQAMSPEQIRTVYGRITGLVDGDASQPYAPGMPAGSVTDDTEQALLVASLLVRGRGSSSGRVALDAGEFAHALLAWEDSMIERGSLDLLGPSTKAALELVRAGEDPLTVGGAGTTNGAAMRVTPIGIAIPRPLRMPSGRPARSRTRHARVSSRLPSWRRPCPWVLTRRTRRPRI